MSGRAEYTIEGFGASDFNAVRGFATILRVREELPASGAPYLSAVSSATRTVVWGDANGILPAILIEPGELPGVYQQALFEESRLGIASPTGDNQWTIGLGAASISSGFVPSDAGFSDVAWIHDEVMPLPSAGEGMFAATAGASGFWRFASQVGMTSDEKVHFIGGWAAAPLLRTEESGLFLIPSATPRLLGSGDQIPGAPNPIAAPQAISMYDLSLMGQHWAAVGLMAGQPMESNEILVLDGSVAIAGTPVIEGAPSGLQGETWGSIRRVVVNDEGDWAAAIEVKDEEGRLRDVIVWNGEVRYQAGDVLSDVYLGTNVSQLAINNSGDLVHGWDVPHGGALFHDDEVVIATGDTIGASEQFDLLTGLFNLVLSDRNVDGQMQMIYTARLVSSSTDPTVGLIKQHLQGDGASCPADFNNDGDFGILDLLAFLDAWYQELPESDLNGSGQVTVEDLLLYLADWFAGCA